jgi:hypothetical protein|nr:MAG TPA: tail completion protein [Caudoviricetes sp.]
MIEKTIYKYLQDILKIPVFISEPEKPPASYVLLDRTDGDDGPIKHATIAFQSYSQTILEACKLNERLKEAMRGATRLDDIVKVKLNSDYNFTDTETKRPRYQAVYDLTYY